MFSGWKGTMFSEYKLYLCSAMSSGWIVYFVSMWKATMFSGLNLYFCVTLYVLQIMKISIESESILTSIYAVGYVVYHITK